MFGAIVLGAFTQHQLARHLPWLPYTVVLLVEGILISFIDEGSNHGLERISVSIAMWENIDPHLLLFAFLPALLFGDAMSLNTHMFSKCFWQCLILAGPGVLFGSFLTATVAKYMLPYNWDWYLSMIVGSILAATDPVAVVALLQQLGASPILTMQITGESLLNDGTAIVVFTLFFRMYTDSTKCDGESYSAGEIVEFFVRLALGGAAVGLLFGWVTLWWMKKVSRPTVEFDMTVQIALTICCAYLSFYVAEAEAGVSGVLATVCAALVLAGHVWPAVCNDHTMHHVWHAIEYLGNTLIFIVAGLITGRAIWKDTGVHIMAEDYGYLVAMYIAMTAIRGLMMLMARPLLPLIGYNVTNKDCFFMTWGGLRGAVGLALAMVVRNSINEKDGARVIFFVSGLAFLTLVVNGVLSGWVLNKLGMISTPSAKKALLANIRRFIRKDVNDAMGKLQETKRFGDVAKADVEKYVHVLSETDTTWLPDHDLLDGSRATRGASLDGTGIGIDSGIEKDESGAVNLDALEERLEEQEEREKHVSVSVSGTTGERIHPARMELVREIFLHVLKQEYWHEVEEGSLPKKSNAVYMLLTSVDCALDPDAHSDSLSDWGHLESLMHVPEWKNRIMNFLDSLIPKGAQWLHDLWFELHDFWITHHEETAFYACTSFLLAHERAQVKTCDVFGGEGVDSPEEALVVEESKAQMALVQSYLDSLNPEVKHSLRVKNMARILLEVEHKKIEKLTHDGLLTPKEAEEMMEQVTHDLHNMSKDRKRTSLRIAHSHTLQRKLSRLNSQVWMKEMQEKAHREHEEVPGYAPSSLHAHTGRASNGGKGNVSPRVQEQDNATMSRTV